MKGNNSTNSNDISPAWNTGKELKWQAFKCLQQIHAWFLNSSNQEGNVIKTQSWPPEWLKWETGLAGKDSKAVDAGILTDCLTAVKMSWMTLGHCWPKRWSTVLSTTRKFHFRQSTKQKIHLCTYHPTKRHSQLITALFIRKPPYGHRQGYPQIDYGMVTVDCHGARRNRQTMAE